MAIKLKLNGKPLDLSPKCPTADAVKAFLDKAPTDEIFTTANILSACRVGSTSIWRVKDRLTGYSCMVGRDRVWGNPRAIAELRRQIA